MWWATPTLTLTATELALPRQCGAAHREAVDKDSLALCGIPVCVEGVLAQLRLQLGDRHRGRVVGQHRQRRAGGRALLRELHRDRFDDRLELVQLRLRRRELRARGRKRRRLLLQSKQLVRARRRCC